jgi:CheY-like chemotaxis protein
MNILLVDDDESFRGMVQTMLTRMGHRTTAVSDGEQAVRQYRQGTFDLVITDLIMPEREGLDTIRTLLRETANVKIIAMSGGGRAGPSAYLNIAERLGATATLTKPFSRQELQTAIDCCATGPSDETARML